MGVWFCSVGLSVSCSSLSEVDCNEAALGSAADLSGLPGMKNGLCSGFLLGGLFSCRFGYNQGKA
ncbi:hypothetical protein EYF80_011325 [Liparis tanakae]|uniref:Uncharacterized protein n=1 Tax=Liparis tanakae TaxID=230148 RepID=A0A4Z2IKN8_9TELE|nr:hypothetical protein EYF80_011325 [Liparis tanakae]